MAVTRACVGKLVLRQLAAINNIRDGIVDKRGGVCDAYTRAAHPDDVREVRGGEERGRTGMGRAFAFARLPIFSFETRFLRSLLFSLPRFCLTTLLPRRCLVAARYLSSSPSRSRPTPPSSKCASVIYP